MSSPTRSRAAERRPRPGSLTFTWGIAEGSFITGARLRGGIRSPHGPYRRGGGIALANEVIEVEINDLRACEDGHERAEREERPERHGRLTALLRPLARDHDDADDHAGEQRDQQRGRDRRAEAESERRRQLYVPHAHAAGVE